MYIFLGVILFSVRVRRKLKNNRQTIDNLGTCDKRSNCLLTTCHASMQRVLSEPAEEGIRK